jgi:hypothetical protein
VRRNIRASGKEESAIVNRWCFNIVILCMFLALGASATRSQVLDNPGRAPGVGKLEFENESMTVIRMHIAPHEKTPMHDIVSPRLVIWLKRT